MVGAALGYSVTILMSSGASEERRRLIRQLRRDELILFDSSGRIRPASRCRAKWPPQSRVTSCPVNLRIL
jgi:hypothetical protein